MFNEAKSNYILTHIYTNAHLFHSEHYEGVRVCFVTVGSHIHILRTSRDHIGYVCPITGVYLVLDSFFFQFPNLVIVNNNAYQSGRLSLIYGMKYV